MNALETQLCNINKRSNEWRLYLHDHQAERASHLSPAPSLHWSSLCQQPVKVVGSTVTTLIWVQI